MLENYFKNKFCSNNSLQNIIYEDLIMILLEGWHTLRKSFRERISLIQKIENQSNDAESF